jgi:hypothetical protein
MKLAPLFALSLLLGQVLAQSNDRKSPSLRKAKVFGDFEKQGQDLARSKAIQAAKSVHTSVLHNRRLELGPSPAVVDIALSPGTCHNLTMCVQTRINESAQKKSLQVYLLADVTGSMGGVLNQVQTHAVTLTTLILDEFPLAQFAAGEYRDLPHTNPPFSALTDFGPEGDASAALSAISSWTASGGSDGPEGQFYALHQIATAGAGTADWDPSPSKAHVLVWFGDAPGHDPICSAVSSLPYDITEATVTTDLIDAGIIVIAISTPTGYPLGLNDDPGLYSFDYTICASGGSAGQATRIAAATGGLDLTSTVEGIVPTIVAAVTTVVPATVTVIPVNDCTPGLDVTFDPPISIANAGDEVCMTESIKADGSLAPGSIAECEVQFVNNDNLNIGGPQEVTVKVLNVSKCDVGEVLSVASM